MKNKNDKFFDDINFLSIVDNIKGIYTSNGTMSILLDMERVLDEADLYAFKNWSLGELVQGPDMGRYTTTCVFMWPYKMMPDPRGALRLINIGCKVEIAKSKIKVPVEVKNYDDFQPGGKYPKMVEKPVWYIRIEVPVELMDDIKEGSIDLADSQIDLADLDDAYDEDLDKQTTEDTDQDQDQSQDQPGDAMDPGMPPGPM